MAKENRGLKPSKKVIRWNRSFVVLAALLVLVLGIVGTTLAWLTDKTDALTNNFTYAKVSCEVLETVNENKTQKSDVRIQNTGNTDAYIRATYVVTIRDEEGNILYDAYETKDFKDYMRELESKISDNPPWQQGSDGYWYYMLPVAPNDVTKPNLFREMIFPLLIEINGKKAETYVEILASAVQAMPTNAVEEAWGATVQTVTVPEDNSTINLLTAPGATPWTPGN